MTVFYFILLALGVTRLTEWLQELMPWTQKAWFVSTSAGVFSALAPILLANTVKLTVLTYSLWAFGLWGASALLHAAESLLRAHKDLANSNWLKDQKPRRPVGW